MLNKPASVVLTSLRDSTDQSVRLASLLAAALSVERCALAHRGRRVRRGAIVSILGNTLVSARSLLPIMTTGGQDEFIRNLLVDWGERINEFVRGVGDYVKEGHAGERTRRRGGRWKLEGEDPSFNQA